MDGADGKHEKGMKRKKPEPTPWGFIRNEKGDTTPLTGENHTIGRSTLCNTRCEGSSVSGVHCSLRRVATKSAEQPYLVVLQCLSRKNSVYFNYQRMGFLEEKVLHHMGRFVLRCDNKRKETFMFMYTGRPSSSTPGSPGRSGSKKKTKFHSHRVLQKGSTLRGKSAWVVGKLIGQGTFSEIYSVENSNGSVQAAVKVEKPKAKSVLEWEISVLREMQGCKQVCDLLDEGKIDIQAEDRANFVVMELCKMSVSEYRKSKMPRQLFSKYEGALIGIEMLQALKALHDKGYLHRDIKPSNFMLARDSNGRRGPVYIVDFGLAKKHLDEKGAALPRRTGKKLKFHGTSLYASLFVHRLEDAGRRDDLWSLIFVIIDCTLGPLPWRGWRNEREKVYKLKNSYCGDGAIPKGLPGQFEDMIKHLHELTYEQRPDYERLERKLAEFGETDMVGKAQYVAENG